MNPSTAAFLMSAPLTCCCGNLLFGFRYSGQRCQPLKQGVLQDPCWDAHAEEAPPEWGEQKRGTIISSKSLSSAVHCYMRPFESLTIVLMKKVVPCSSVCQKLGGVWREQTRSFVLCWSWNMFNTYSVNADDSPGNVQIGGVPVWKAWKANVSVVFLVKLKRRLLLGCRETELVKGKLCNMKTQCEPTRIRAESYSEETYVGLCYGIAYVKWKVGVPVQDPVVLHDHLLFASKIHSLDRKHNKLFELSH